MERVSSKAANTRVLDLDGAERPLRSLWADRTALLVFLPHFGCREQAVQLHDEKDAIRARGAELVFIGNTVPCFARVFAKDLAITTPIYVDPALSSYRALTLRRGAGGALQDAVRALRGGLGQGCIRRDRGRFGGVLMVRRDGAVLYRRVSEGVDDFAPVDEILGALAPGAVATG